MKKVKGNILIILGVQVPIIMTIFIVIILCKLLGIENVPPLMFYGIIAVDIIAIILLCWIISYNRYYDSLL